ncbi:FG-GAP repeat domain-containing protein [Geoalkalibacter ferrihydriticus]|uniref:FG-GAP repeat domain-containing protein n=1 Tax=Geoalkalibacter ferrihydriticus TaxID=392333 RepID=UPI0011138522|nr:FG-GAP and VCBS repeat-containing protein [Geoalkalibacter ferrihydriticus]
MPDSLPPLVTVQPQKDDGPIVYWKAPLSPKHRAIVSYMEPTGNILTFRAQGVALESDLSAYADAGTLVTKPGDLGVRGGDSESRVFSLAQAAGNVLQSYTLDQPFMGTKTYSQVPTGVICSSYLTKTNTDGTATGLWLELTGRGETTETTQKFRRMRLDVPRPYYKYNFNADGSIYRDSPSTDMNVAHDMVAWDWNGDGYTDYLVTYLTNPTTWEGKHEHDYKNMKVAAVFVDGKSLYDASLDTTKTVSFWVDATCAFTTGGDVVGGLTNHLPPNSVRTAVGDLDNDGLPEVALYYTQVNGTTGWYSHNNVLKILTIAYDGSRAKFAWKGMGSEVGAWKIQNDSVAVAMGDLDGDGVDELAVLHCNGKVYLDVYKYNPQTKDLEKLVEGVQVGEYFNATETQSSAPGIEASIADLDGDGIGELVWISTNQRTPPGAVYVWDTLKIVQIAVHKWPVTVDEVSGERSAVLHGAGTKKTYRLDDVVGGWTLNYTYPRFSMDTGRFVYPDPPAPSKPLELRKQIGLVTLAPPAGPYYADHNASLYWGVFQWDATEGLQLLGIGRRFDAAKAGNVVPSLVAADLDHESMVLGQPYSYTVTNNIEPLFIIQAPPKHWDEITYEGAPHIMDAFSLLGEYSTSLASETSDSHSTATTHISSGQWSVATDFAIRKGNPFKILPPLFEAGGKYASEQATKHDSKIGETIHVDVDFTAEADDQIQYRKTTHKVYRYPVLFPASQAITDDGSQAFLQYILPIDADVSLSPTPGTAVDWYEPWHNGLNLFSYPRTLEGTRDYPLGGDSKTIDDPWKDINGLVLARSMGTLIGNPDESTWSFTIEDEEKKEDLKSTKHTISSYVNVTPQLDFHVVDIETSVEYDNEYSTANDSITTTDHSTLSQVKASWPGTRDYESPSGRAYWEQEFYADAAVYTSDTGNVSVAYAVSQLYNQNSSLWGPASPYDKAADPALNLPRQYKYDPSSKQWTKPAGVPDLTGRVRGLRFLGIKDRVLPANQVVRANLRVYNYSFVPTGPVTVTFLYEATSGQPDVSKATVLPMAILNPIVSIPGRHKGNSADGYQASDDNWQDVEIDFTTPSGVSTGYLHVVLSTTGGNLNTANDAGNVPVAIQTPATPKSAVMARVADSHSVAEITSGTLKSLQLVTGSLSVRPLLSDGSLGEETTSLWPGQAAVVQVEVLFDDADGVDADGLVGVDVTLLDDKGVVGQRSVPMLLNGIGQTVQMFYTAPRDGGIVPLEMVVTSSSLPPEADYDPEGRSTWTELMVGTP